MTNARGKATKEAPVQTTEPAPDKPISLGEGHVSGNLTQDPELRFTPTGRAVAKLRVAYSQRVKDPATGIWQDGEPQFFDVDVWGKQGENCAEALQRGDRIVACGEWFRRHWETREGEKRTSVSLTARDIGPSLLFKLAAVARWQKTGPPVANMPQQDAPPPGDDDAPDEPPF
jgi:single-strand DNA-binding protein